jgi:actin-related protein 6
MNPKNNAIVQEYILPDLSTNQSGRIRQPDDMVETDQILVMNNERFTVPELLFRPDDIGMYPPNFDLVYDLANCASYRCYLIFILIGLDQAGLAATISFSISLLPSDLQGMFWANIGLIGGTTKFSGFRERL